MTEIILLPETKYLCTIAIPVCSIQFAWKGQTRSLPRCCNRQLVALRAKSAFACNTFSKRGDNVVPKNIEKCCCRQQPRRLATLRCWQLQWLLTWKVLPSP